MTPRDGLPRFSARSARRGDAGHREACATLSESLGKPPLRSSMRPVGGGRKAVTMRIKACPIPPKPRKQRRQGKQGPGQPAGEDQIQGDAGDERKGKPFEDLGQNPGVGPGDAVR